MALGVAELAADLFVLSSCLLVKRENLLLVRIFLSVFGTRRFLVPEMV